MLECILHVCDCDVMLNYRGGAYTVTRSVYRAQPETWLSRRESFETSLESLFYHDG